MQCSKGSVNPFWQKDFRIATKSLRLEDSRRRHSIPRRAFGGQSSVRTGPHRRLLINSLSTALSPTPPRIDHER